MPENATTTGGVPTLPRTWRPFGPRMAALAFGVILVGGFVFLWLRFDPDTQASVNIFQKGTVIALVLLGLALLNGMARSRVVADEDGLTVVNGYRKRVLAWSEVGVVRVPNGAPWPQLDQGDDVRIGLMGIHTSDGARAEKAVRELRAVVAAHKP
ncbi:PH domain-containing protein [Nocardioides sp. zg-536]|uniref:PH domain-containing protein n=1 Tax=Nocardioides faecalis TaxID=2803858 RepID=A0A938Y2G4_9ACTN|nr:PH domain-containing protein [Nocardioides faecalis]MBM9460636.1 PH domain-containing protein [Nocardioides faecalis]MBS4754301.1 PH domain-containing protein [Nocardioides faecalis]QVI57446.1 PH domain-containing protein [Nocardioides faecalis]